MSALNTVEGYTLFSPYIWQHCLAPGRSSQEACTSQNLFLFVLTPILTDYSSNTAHKNTPENDLWIVTSTPYQHFTAGSVSISTQYTTDMEKSSGEVQYFSGAQSHSFPFSLCLTSDKENHVIIINDQFQRQKP